MADSTMKTSRNVGPNNANGSSVLHDNTAWAAGLSQQDLMEKDTVLVLDNDDMVVGSASKKNSHVFSKEQPRGILHRAFSVFLFDESDGRMLLQQRASSKITFPNVRTIERESEVAGGIGWGVSYLTHF